MKSLMAAGVTILLVACTSGPPPVATTQCTISRSAEGTICAFYTRYLEMRPSGLPTVEQQAVFAPWLSAGLEQRMRVARAVQAQFRVQHPGEKPPLVDGFLFASLFEGPTAFTVAGIATSGAVTRVTVDFRYGDEAQWQDVVIVQREAGRFVIDDVEYGGAGPFNPAGRLSEALEHAGH